MVDVNVDFVLENDEPINAEFIVEPDVTYTADIMLSAASSFHNELFNRDLPDQHPMGAITGLESALEGLSNDITAEYNRAVEAEETLDGKIDSEADTRGDEITRVEGLISDEETRAKGAEQDLAGSIDSNHQAISDHVSNKNNPHEVTKAQVGLGNVDNTSDADKPVSTATQTALDGKVDKTTTADRVYGTDSGGNQTTYDKGSFGQVDDVKVAGVSVVTSKVANLGSMASETASDYYTSAQVDTALSSKQDTISDLSTIRSNATQGKSAYDTIQTYGNIVTHNVSEFATASQGALADTALQPNDNISELTNNLSYQTATQVANSIAVETNNRELADNGLQSQIDAIVSSSDVFDIVGTYAELQAYDITTVPVNDIIKVLVDETHSGAATYYRCVETGGVKSWSYIGSEGAYYTKGEADSKFVPQTRTVNSKALSSDITLTASDVGALPDSTVIPTVNDATLTIQKNSTTVGSFTANQATNATIDLSIPTDTSDLTNGAGFITGITSTDVTNALGYTPYDDTNPDGFISGITSGDVTTALGYTPYDNSNPAGYTSNVGTVTSVNNTLPDGNGNVTLAVDQTYDGTSANPQSGVAIAGAGFLTGISSGDVTTALGYTPVDPSNLATVATSGDYDDLLNKPTIPAAQIQSDWTQSDNTKVDFIKNKPTLATVATSGLYSDLSGTPTIPIVDQTYDGTSANAQSGVAIEGELSNYATTSSLATVATSGLYSDLSGTPTVDQVYDGTSANAQSGIAVASAISTKQDSATALTTTNTYYSGNTLYIG